MLAFRPRRRGTPPRSAPVIETQIVLAVVGAIGDARRRLSSLARAFGIVGAANLIRYRAKIEDPKDAVVMLSTLSMGLCCGVELYGLGAVCDGVPARGAVGGRVDRAGADASTSS